MIASLMKNNTGLDQRVFEGINVSKKALIETLKDGRSFLKRTNRHAGDLIDDMAHKLSAFRSAQWQWHLAWERCSAS